VTDCEIDVRLTARARRSELAAGRTGELLAWVTAPPLDGRANEALCRLIAKRARIGIGRVSIVRGARSRYKVVRVVGMDEAQLRQALGIAADGPARDA
jgi:uncharacterized protein YggU (UPF0235/DUF167 family)